MVGQIFADQTGINAHLVWYLNRFLYVKVVTATYNKEKAIS